MGGTVSTGEDNDDLVDNLVKRDCITSGRVEHVFRAVDRGHYFTEECRDSAYKDTAWRSDNLHLSAPCIYSSVMENLSLKPGHSFLNIGSGTGYVSTMAGLIIESGGVNHGVELFQDVIDYAYERLAEFTANSTAVDQFDFCPPQFVCGNGLLISGGRQYDRVYCGARCPLSELAYLKQLLKIGGVLVVPVNDHLKRIERVGEKDWKVEDKLSVSFASLIEPSVSGHKTELTMPSLVPASLQQLCRTHIRRVLRTRLLAAQPPPTARTQRWRRPVGRRAEQARRIQRLVMPLLGAAVAGENDSDPDEQEEGEEGDQEGEEVGRRRPSSGDGERRREAPGGEETAAGRPDRQQEQEDSDHSEEAYMELAGTPAAETSPQQEQGDRREGQQEASPAEPQEQERQETPTDGSPQPEAGQARASLKRSSEESVAGGDGETAAGAGPSDTQKRGRRDKFDSGLGDSPPPPALPPRDHSEPENGVAASSDDEEDDGDDDDDDDDDDLALVGRGRRLMLLPPPSRWGGRSARTGAEMFATELNRFLAAGSDDDDEEELDAEGERRSRCPLNRRRRARPSRHAAADAGRQLADQLRAQIAALPLPPPLRLYVNLGRPL